MVYQLFPEPLRLTSGQQVTRLFASLGGEARRGASVIGGKKPAAAQIVLIALVAAIAFPSMGADTTEVPSARPGSLEVAALDRTTPVDFEKEILPVFKRNCLACHGSRKPKGGLVLETPQTISKGGDGGEVVKAGSGAESFLFQVAAHMEEDSIMPPKNNKVKAENLTPEELALLKLWIDQGAKGQVQTARPVQWKPIPPALNAIHSVAVTDDGQFAACARANRLFVYHLPSQELAAELVDGQLTNDGLYPSGHGAAHRDFVQSLAFHPDGDLLASGGYREIKLWRRVRSEPRQHLALDGQVGEGAMALSRDGRWLATAQAQGPVQLWNAREGKMAKAFTEFTNQVTALDFSDDNRYLAASDGMTTVMVFPLAGDRAPVSWESKSLAKSLVWLAGTSRLAVGSEDKLIRVWEIPETPEAQLSVVREWSGHEGPVTVLRRVPGQPAQLASGSEDGKIRFWNIEDGKLLRELDHGAPVLDLALRGDGKRLASTAGQQVVKLWNAEDGKLLAELKGDRYTVEAVASRERAKMLAAAELGYRKSELERQEKEQKERVVRVAKAKESFEPAEKAFVEKQKAKEEVLQAKTKIEKDLESLHADIKRVTEAFEQADQLAKASQATAKQSVERAALARAEAERALQTKMESESFYAEAQRILDRASTSASLSNLSPEEKTAAEQRSADAATVAQKSKSLAETASSTSDAKVKEAEQMRAEADKAIDALTEKAFAAGKVQVDFERVTVGVEERLKQATNSVTEAQKKLDNAEKELQKAELERSRAETELQLAQKSEEEGTREVADAQSALKQAEEGEQRSNAELEAARQGAQAAEKPLLAVAFSSDQRSLITAGETGAIQTWDSEDGDAFDVYRWTGNPIRHLASSGDHGAVFAMTTGQAFSFGLDDRWVLEGTIGTGDVTSPLEDRVTALAFSPDGRWLASGGGEPSRGGEIKIWDVKDRSAVRDWPEVHSDTVLSLEFSPDGKYLASGAADKFARVENVEDGQVVRTFEGHTHHVMGVSWKADGRTLATSGADNVVKIWDFVKGDRKKNIQGFDKEITSIHFVGVGDEAVVSSGDNRVRLLKEDGKTVRDFGGIKAFQHAAAATPDGSFVVGGGEDSVLRVWNGKQGDLIASFAPPNRE